MTLASEIVKSALREAQILDIQASPSPDQIDEALPLLRGILARHVRPPVMTIWLGAEPVARRQRGEILRDFTPYAADRPVPQDVYLNCMLAGPTEIMLPADPGDGARLVIIDVKQSFGAAPLTLLANGNTVEGADSIVLDANGVGASLMYRRDEANWIVLPTLAEFTPMPFPEEFDDLWRIELAMRLNPRYGAEMSPITVELYQNVRSRFKSRYQMTVSAAAPDVLWSARIEGTSDRPGW